MQTPEEQAVFENPAFVSTLMYVFFPWVPHGFLCVPMGSQGYPMVSYGFLWVFLRVFYMALPVYYEIFRVFMKFSEKLRIRRCE